MPSAETKPPFPRQFGLRGLLFAVAVAATLVCLAVEYQSLPGAWDLGAVAAFAAAAVYATAGRNPHFARCWLSTGYLLVMLATADFVYRSVIGSSYGAFWAHMWLSLWEYLPRVPLIHFPIAVMATYFAIRSKVSLPYPRGLRFCWLAVFVAGAQLALLIAALGLLLNNVPGN